MKNGIDRLSEYRSLFEGKALGLLTNQSGLDADFQSTVDILNKAFHLVRLYAPEHGVRGELQAGVAVENSLDRITGLPVCPVDRPGLPIDLSGIDLFVYDIQDVGLRVYTYIYSMADAMTACAKAGIPFVILDRANPLGLSRREGNVFRPDFCNCIGRYGLPLRYGLTVGELARYINTEYKIGAELTVIPCEGLDRKATFADFNTPWVPTSPNLPTFDSLLMYVGTVLFEGTNLSEGRGTTRSFETVGAPWLDAEALSEELKKYDFPGVRWRTLFFQPTFSKYEKEICNGLQFYVTDPETLDAFRFCLYVIKVAERLFPDKMEIQIWEDALTGSDEVKHLALENIEEYLSAEREKYAEFEKKAAPYLLY